jgi:hypothetical protein
MEADHKHTHTSHMKSCLKINQYKHGNSDTFLVFSISHIVPHSKTSNDKTINKYRTGKGVKGSDHRVTYIISKHTLRGIKEIHTQKKPA